MQHKYVSSLWHVGRLIVGYGDRNPSCILVTHEKRFSFPRFSGYSAWYLDFILYTSNVFSHVIMLQHFTVLSRFFYYKTTHNTKTNQTFICYGDRNPSCILVTHILDIIWESLGHFRCPCYYIICVLFQIKVWFVFVLCVVL
jgi:hypothetical protein